MHAHTTRWLVVLALIFCTQSLAQPFPTRPITIIIPFAGGCPTDALARLVAAGVTFIRQSWGNHAPPATPAEVARAQGVPAD